VTVVRNIQVKLDVDKDDHVDLDETFEQFREAAQLVADYGWSDDPTEIIDSKPKLHDATYADVREETDLTANHVQAARSLAANALGNCKDRILEESEKASKPGFRGTVVVYDARTITYNDDHCTLSTVDGRVTAEYVLPDDTRGTLFEEYWEKPEWERGEATLHKRDDTYYLHVSMKKDPEESDEASTSEYGAVLGVDLNVDGYLAVTSTGTFLGNADYLNHKRKKYERRRGNLQQTGTRSAHLTMKSIGDRLPTGAKTTCIASRSLLFLKHGDTTAMQSRSRP
jgi:predicted transposase